MHFDHTCKVCSQVHRGENECDALLSVPGHHSTDASTTILPFQICEARCAQYMLSRSYTTSGYPPTSLTCDQRRQHQRRKWTIYVRHAACRVYWRKTGVDRVKPTAAARLGGTLSTSGSAVYGAGRKVTSPTSRQALGRNLGQTHYRLRLSRLGSSDDDGEGGIGTAMGACT